MLQMILGNATELVCLTLRSVTTVCVNYLRVNSSRAVFEDISGFDMYIQLPQKI